MQLVGRRCGHDESPGLNDDPGDPNNHDSDRYDLEHDFAVDHLVP